MADDDISKRGAGGTTGGLMEFLAGAMMQIAGGYLLTNQVVIVSRGFRLYMPWSSAGLGLVLRGLRDHDE